MSIHFDRTKERSKNIKRELFLINHLGVKPRKANNSRTTFNTLYTEQKNPFLRNNSAISRVRLEPYIDYQLPMDDIVLTPETKGIRHFPSLGTLANFQLFTESMDKSKKKRQDTSRGQKREYNPAKKIDDSWDKLDLLTYDERAQSPYDMKDTMYKTVTDNHFMSTFNKTGSKFYRSNKIPEDTVTNLTKFSENKTKYNFYQPKNSLQLGLSPPRKRSLRNEVLQDIDILKSSTKYSNKDNKQILANIRVKSRKADRPKAKTVHDGSKNSLVITGEDEQKIKLIKAKMQISKIFYNKMMTEDEKNHHYQRLLNEYKPDRGLHDPSTCDEISTYLITNKLFLLKNEKLQAEFGAYI